VIRDGDTINIPDRAVSTTFCRESEEVMLPDGISLEPQLQAAAERVEASYPVVVLLREKRADRWGDPEIEAVIIPTRTTHSHAVQDAQGALHRWTMEPEIDLEMPRGSTLSDEL